MNQRRCTAHSPNDVLTAAYRVLDLEPVPTALIVAENFVSCKKELKDLTCFAPGARRKHTQKEVSKYSKEKNHEHRKARNQKHRRHDAESKKVLSFFL